VTEYPFKFKFVKVSEGRYDVHFEGRRVGTVYKAHLWKSYNSWRPVGGLGIGFGTRQQAAEWLVTVGKVAG
jgi:hypothetical protein